MELFTFDTKNILKIHSPSVVFFLKELRKLYQETYWRFEKIERRASIVFRHDNHPNLFDPLTAVYFELSGGKVINRCFLVPELVTEYGIPESDVVEIAYAIDACVVSKRYNPYLRNDLLRALHLKPEKIIVYK